MHQQIPTAALSIQKLDSLGLLYFTFFNNTYSTELKQLSGSMWLTQFWANSSQEISNLLLPIAINQQQMGKVYWPLKKTSIHLFQV